MSHSWLMQSEYFKSERHYLSLKSSKEQKIHSAHFRENRVHLSIGTSGLSFIIYYFGSGFHCFCDN